MRSGSIMSGGGATRWGSITRRIESRQSFLDTSIYDSFHDSQLGDLRRVVLGNALLSLVDVELESTQFGSPWCR